MEDTMLTVYRSECKYLLSFAEANIIKQRLMKLLFLDEHSKHGEYLVRSLYFDSLNDIDYFTKSAGTANRKKVRLRIYNYTDMKVKLEVKYKFNNHQNKKSLSIERSDAINLINQNYEVLLKYASNNLFALEVFNILKNGAYKPVSLIEYKRLAFVYEEYNTRITLDSQIRFSESDFRLFEKQPLYQSVSNEGVILEIKFNKHLADFISNVLKVNTLNQLAVSKYCLGRPSLEKYFID